MRILTTGLLSMAVMGLLCSSVGAAGMVEKGKALFNDPNFAGGTSGKSCNSCHPDGKGLDTAGLRGRKEWKNPGGTWLSLQDANNVCIILANKGKAIDPKSAEMKDLMAYIKSLAKK